MIEKNEFEYEKVYCIGQKEKLSYSIEMVQSETGYQINSWTAYKKRRVSVFSVQNLVDSAGKGFFTAG